MSFVEDDGAVASEVVVVHGLAQQHSVGHVLEDGVGPRLVLETNAVSNLLAELDVHLLGHTLGDGHGSDTTRLGTGDHLGILLRQGVKEVQ